MAYARCGEVVMAELIVEEAFPRLVEEEAMVASLVRERWQLRLLGGQTAVAD